MEAREVARSDKGQKYLFVQLGMLHPAGERFHSLPFSRYTLSRSCKRAMAFPLFPTALEMGRYLWPLDGPSIDAAWRAQYLRRLGYNALSSLIIL